ncbi:unnamed protein product [Leuciscus chuanchicus]
MWLMHDVLAPDQTKEVVSTMIKDLIIEEAHKTTPSPASTSNPEVQVGEPEAGHQSGLFTGDYQAYGNSSI